MPVIDRVETLRARHAMLEAELEEETRRPMPDTSHIAQLKREKLRLKDEMMRLTRV